MHETLQSNFKIILAAATVLILLFGGCKSNTNETASYSTSLSQTLPVTELSTMNNYTSNSNITAELCNLLGCDERTAETVQKNISRAIKSGISTVTAESDNAGSKLTVTDENGNVYVVFMSRGYFVSEIFKSSENGERIYFAIE